MVKKDYTNQSKESLVKEVEKLEKRKKYGLVWDEEREPEKVVSECKEKLPILEEVKEKEIKSSKNAPINIIIEGDNYHALSVLNYTHQGKIDVIYIDPPYNTGAKDWKYNNNFVDKNDTYRHSKWLNMMSKRFKLAKNLLKEDGVLICTIDENEIFHLGCLLEELFTGYEIHPIAIVHNPRGVQGDNFSYSHEYALFIFKKGLKVIGDKVREETLVEELRDHGGESLRTDAKNCFYPILVKDLTIVGFGDVPDIGYHPESKNIKRNDGLIEVWPIDVKGIERKWVFARQSIEEIKNKLFVKKKKNGEIDIFRKKDTQKPRTVWISERYDASTFGSKIVNGLTGKQFPFPKSIYTTRDCIDLIIKQRKEATVLDYFAGSGTTGHAVMLLNKEDGGSRIFILCTNNENNIAEDICYPRIKKVIEGDENYEEITGIPANLKYFKTGFVDAETTDENKKKLVDRSTEMLCLKERCFDKVLENEDFHIYKDNKEKFLGIIYNDEGIEPFKKELNNIRKKVIVYVFSLDDSAREEEFEDVANLVELKPIPAAILNVYRRIFK
jgi:adenine-specific DNA-methyltransferase